MKPYIICHMVASIDGRIDCGMVDKISGDEYYTTLEELDCPTLLEGRVTMAHYYASEEPFVPKVNRPVGAESVYVAEESDAYMVTVDTMGRLRWESNTIEGVPLVCVVSEQVSEEYLETLRQRQISWIAVGKERMGGGHINGGFLEAGLIDEVSLLLAPGIDGRKGQISLFDGISQDARVPLRLKLEDIRRLPNDVVWLRYKL